MDERKRDAAPPLGRRRFVRWLGAAGLAGAAMGLGAALTPRAAGAQGPGGEAPAVPPEVKDEAGHLLAIVRGRLPEGALDDAQADALRDALEGGVRGSKALREHKLANGVEPATIFRAVPPRPARAGGGR